MFYNKMVHKAETIIRETTGKQDRKLEHAKALQVKKDSEQVC